MNMCFISNDKIIENHDLDEKTAKNFKIHFFRILTNSVTGFEN